jgi:alpha-tubulin suppressor-like RCC1 family protein
VYTGCVGWYSFITLCTGEIYAVGSNSAGQLFNKDIGKSIMVQLDSEPFWKEKEIVHMTVGGYSSLALVKNRPLLETRLHSVYSFYDVDFV